MRHKHRAGAGALALLALVCTASPAQAAMSPEDAQALVEKLGPARSAGTYFDPASQKMVVMLVPDGNAAAADHVRRQGGRVRFVANSSEELADAESELAPVAGVSGTAHGVDVVSNRVLVSVDPTVEPDDRQRIASAVQAKSGAAKLEELPSPIQLLLNYDDRPHAGQPIFQGEQEQPSNLCTRGFNVVGPLGAGHLSAGHCDPFNLSRIWDQTVGPLLVSQTVASSYPINDYALMRYTGFTNHPPPFVTLHGAGSVAIFQVGDPYIGQPVTKSGAYTHVSSGAVTALNQTVYVNKQSVGQLVRTSLCGGPGDSGAPVFDRGTALGILSAGTIGTRTFSGCTGTGPTYFQPVSEALKAYGVKLAACPNSDQYTRCQ